MAQKQGHSLLLNKKVLNTSQGNKQPSLIPTDINITH